MDAAHLYDERDIRTISDAVQTWYRYYEVSPDEKVSKTLCTAAIRFFNDGYQSSDDISTLLIGTYVGRWATRVNAPTSDSSH